MIKNLKPGAEVAVVERDEAGEAVEATRYMFLAVAKEFVICSPFIACADGCKDIDGTLLYHAQETAEDYDTDLCLFPIKDCYETIEEAKEAFALETDTEDEENGDGKD